MAQLSKNDRDLLEKIVPTLIARGSVKACLDMLPEPELNRVYSILSTEKNLAADYLEDLCSL